MALEGPKVIYSRKDEDPVLGQALRLARMLEDVLGEASACAPAASASEATAVHSTRIVRALAASIVDELEALVRGNRKTNVA